MSLAFLIAASGLFLSLRSVEERWQEVSPVVFQGVQEAQTQDTLRALLEFHCGVNLLDNLLDMPGDQTERQTDRQADRQSDRQRL